MTNKEIVLNMVETVFNRHEVEKAGMYIREDYIQHNPGVKSGLEAFICAFRDSHFMKFPEFRMIVKHAIAEDNFVVIHAHAIAVPGKDEAAVTDIYRLENGMIVEHWDVLQKMPEHFVHENGMF